MQLVLTELQKKNVRVKLDKDYAVILAITELQIITQKARGERNALCWTNFTTAKRKTIEESAWRKVLSTQMILQDRSYFL